MSNRGRIRKNFGFKILINNRLDYPTFSPVLFGLIRVDFIVSHHIHCKKNIFPKNCRLWPLVWNLKKRDRRSILTVIGNIRFGNYLFIGIYVDSMANLSLSWFGINLIPSPSFSLPSSVAGRWPDCSTWPSIASTWRTTLISDIIMGLN